MKINENKGDFQIPRTSSLSIPMKKKDYSRIVSVISLSLERKIDRESVKIKIRLAIKILTKIHLRIGTNSLQSELYLNFVSKAPNAFIKPFIRDLLKDREI